VFIYLSRYLDQEKAKEPFQSSLPLLLPTVA